MHLSFRFHIPDNRRPSWIWKRILQRTPFPTTLCEMQRAFLFIIRSIPSADNMTGYGEIRRCFFRFPVLN